MKFGLSAKEPFMGMPQMALCSSSGLLDLAKFSNNLSPLNFLIQKKTLRVLPLKTRYLGNLGCRTICMSSDGKKMSARLSQMNKVLQDAEERAAGANEPIPRVSLEHVMVSFARSGGPGGQNVNKANPMAPSDKGYSSQQPFGKFKPNRGFINFNENIINNNVNAASVNTKVDMRFNVAAADWLSPRIRERILQMEKNRINNDGELVISSTKTRTQKGNVEDALEKLQAIIDAAAYVPPPPSEEKKQRIRKLAAIEDQKRLKMKKAHSQKKATRRNDKYGWE